MAFSSLWITFHKSDISYVLWPCTVNIKLSNFILCSLENDDMESSKHCVKLLVLIFIIRCVTKSNLIWILKREDKLHFFRRVEDCSKKQVKCNGAIEFLHLCQNFKLTLTFAKVNQTKSKKWSKASEQFSTKVIREELRSKLKQKATLRMR